VGLALTSVLVVGGVVGGCGSDGGKGHDSGAGDAGAEQNPLCTQGDTRSCIGAGRCAGAQECTTSGIWTSCDCGDNMGSAGRGAHGTGGGATGGTGAQPGVAGGGAGGSGTVHDGGVGASGGGGGTSGTGGSAGASGGTPGAGGTSGANGGTPGAGGTSGASGSAVTGGLSGTSGNAGASGSSGVEGTGGGSGGAGGTGGTVYGPEGPSCSGMNGTECNGESCCTSIVLPGGSYLMGRSTEECTGCADGCPLDMTCSSNEQPEHPATVSGFALDKYEVTVGRFTAFANAYEGGWRPGVGDGANAAVEAAQDLPAGATGWQGDWDAELPVDRSALIANITCEPFDPTWGRGHDSYPMNCVGWFEAFAFCAWDDGRLPTEAEWEYAAAGGDENRVYPWGNDVTEPLPANYQYEGDGGSPFIPVGSYPGGTGRWGHADLAGSMYEWMFDFSAGSTDDYSATALSGCSDCANLSADYLHVLRGGAHSYTASYLRAVERAIGGPTGHDDQVGLRCARRAP
jgi:sulfatase modifying factor 1